MTSPAPLSAALAREFLVQRLVADARNRLPHTDNKPHSNSSGNNSDEDPHSDSSSDPGANDLSDRTVPNMTFPPVTGGAFFPNPLQYVAGLASLAQMNFMQPTANTLPLLYPHLYQSLLTFPDLEKLRLALQSPGKSPLLNAGRMGFSPPIYPPPSYPGEAKQSSEKVKSSQNLHQTKEFSPKNVSPSPRKRPSSQQQKTTSLSSSGGQMKPQKCPTEKEYQLTDSFGSPTKKPRAVKRIQFDEETASPVSGMFIKEAATLPPTEQLQAEADLDESARFVEITEEAKAELAKIENVIGDYVCRLCRVKYEDPFKLAQHKCPRIIHEEYRCPECDKVFSCPANLASHRRWHKPRHTAASNPHLTQAQTQLTNPPSFATMMTENAVTPTNFNAIFPQQNTITSLQEQLTSKTQTEINNVAGSPLRSPHRKKAHYPNEELRSPASTVSGSEKLEAEDTEMSSTNEEPMDLTPGFKSSSPHSDDSELVRVSSNSYACDICDQVFESHFLLRSHAISHTNFAHKQL